jgi:hypothetical protein
MINPYTHVYRPASMSGCLDCCPACRWEAPVAPETLTEGDRALLAGLKITWDGDAR